MTLFTLKLFSVSRSRKLCCLLPPTPQIFLGKECPEASAPLGARSSFLHSRIEEGIAEEIQRATENNASVVPCLESRDQKGVLPNRMWILERSTFKRHLASLGMSKEELVNLQVI